MIGFTLSPKLGMPSLFREKAGEKNQRGDQRIIFRNFQQKTKGGTKGLFLEIFSKKPILYMKNDILLLFIILYII